MVWWRHRKDASKQRFQFQNFVSVSWRRNRSNEFDFCHSKESKLWWKLSSTGPTSSQQHADHAKRTSLRRHVNMGEQETLSRGLWIITVLDFEHLFMHLLMHLCISFCGAVNHWHWHVLDRLSEAPLASIAPKESWSAHGNIPLVFWCKSFKTST